MTKERLEELIKQNGLIFDKYGSEIDLKSGNGIYFAFSQNRLFKMKEMPNIALEHWRLNEIFETEEQAEWHLKTHAERTERFEPPMWEDIENEYLFNFVVNNEHLHFFVNKERELISVMNEAHFYLIFHKANVSKNLLKKGYEKACEIVRDLFKGEK